MNPTSISIINTVINGVHDVKTIKKINRVKDWQFNELVKKLVQDGFIKKEGNTLSLQKNAKVALLKKIASTWNLESLLRNSNDLVFSYLTESLTVNEILTKTGLSTATIYRALSDLRAIGVIQKETHVNEFNPRKSLERIHVVSSKTDLIDFAKILRIEREKMSESDAEIIYTDKEKTLKKITRGKVINGELTSFSVFSDNGIQYESPYDYYIIQKNPPDIHDVIIHSVLASYKDNDKMGLIMSIVFYVDNKDKTDAKRLRKIASSFDIASVWLDVEAYIRKDRLKNKKLFLPWNEFVSKAKLYEIDTKKYIVSMSSSLLWEDIANNIDDSMRIFLIGGENMRLKNLKAVTKDCDIVVEDASDFKILCKILTEHLGYERIIKTEYSQEDLRLYPDDILTHPEKSRIDLFTKRVMRDLLLSDNMIETADYIEYGKLQVGVLRNEYVFLLKAVAGREGDIQDMEKLSQDSQNRPKEFRHGVFDWDTVWEEIIHQEKINPMRELAVSIFEQISILVDQTGVIAPVFEKLKRHAIERLILRLIRGGRQSLKEVVFKLRGGDISEQMVRNRIDALVRDGTIRKYRIQKEVFVANVNTPYFPYGDWSITMEKTYAYLSWRFPVRDQPTPLEIQRFVNDISAMKYDFIRCMDDVIVKYIDVFLDYERQYFPSESCKAVDVARGCIGLSDPKLGGNKDSSFYIRIPKRHQDQKPNK